MIFITQLIYVKEGQENSFYEFEDIAVAAMSRYNGRMLLRVRPSETEIIGRNIDSPYEIHIVEFLTDSDFNNFLNDENRKNYLHLKEKSIKSVISIKGTPI